MFLLLDTGLEEIAEQYRGHWPVTGVVIDETQLHQQLQRILVEAGRSWSAENIEEMERLTSGLSLSQVFDVLTWGWPTLDRGDERMCYSFFIGGGAPQFYGVRVLRFDRRTVCLQMDLMRHPVPKYAFRMLGKLARLGGPPPRNLWVGAMFGSLLSGRIPHRLMWFKLRVHGWKPASNVGRRLDWGDPA